MKRRIGNKGIGLIVGVMSCALLGGCGESIAAQFADQVNSVVQSSQTQDIASTNQISQEETTITEEITAEEPENEEANAVELKLGGGKKFGSTGPAKEIKQREEAVEEAPSAKEEGTKEGDTKEENVPKQPVEENAKPSQTPPEESVNPPAIEPEPELIPIPEQVPQVQPQPEVLPQRPPFGTFSAYDLAGNVITSDIFAQKKLTMVNVWATFCGPCIRELPDLQTLSTAYGSDFQIIGIVEDVYDSNDITYINKAKDIVNRCGVTYTNVYGQQAFYNILWDVYAVPTTYFVDSNGGIVGEPVVGANVKKYKEIIENYLK